MRSKWIPGQDLLRRWRIHAGELFIYVKNGLQPYDDVERPILPPGVEEVQRQLREYELMYLQVVLAYHKKTGKYVDFSKPDLARDSICPNDGHLLCTRMQKCRDFLKSHSSWGNYEFPEDDYNGDEAKDIVVSACYKLEDVNKSEQEEDSTDKIQPADERSTDDAPDYDKIIRSFKVSYLDDMEIKIIYNGRSTNHACGSIGFRDSNTKEWLTFIEILSSTDHVYKLGPAHHHDKGLHKMVPIKEYSKRIALLKSIEKKLLSFLTKQYGVVFPREFKLYELQPTHGDGAYSFKFQIPQDKPSYKTKDQAITFLKKLVRDGAPTDTINDAVQIAMESGATRDEVSEITAPVFSRAAPCYHETTDEPD